MGKPKVVVLGSGFGGLEAAFYLRHKMGDEVAITLVSDRDHFLFKPNTIYIPFGEDPAKFIVPLDKPTQRKHIEFKLASATGIDTQNKRVVTSAGDVAYDKLVVATGAAMRPQEIPGMKEHALTLWTPEEMLRLRDGLQRTAERAKSGERAHLVFLVPPNNKCSGPLYELVLMTDTWLKSQHVRGAVDLVFATHEQSYIQAFGPRLNTVVEQEFEDRGISGFRGFVVTGIEPNVVRFQSGYSLPFDLLISFPPYVAATAFPGLPTDERGFIKVEADGRRVRDQADIFAVGDAANFPIKQAFLALLQADAAADHLAADLRGTTPDVNFEPMSMCVMEELNKATFAQVPLEYTADPNKPIAVATHDTEHYKVGVSPIWRLGKKALGLYLPWRFGHGEPFHAGFAWDAMDLGLKVMSKLLAK